MLLRRSIGLVWLGRKPHTAAPVGQIAGLRQRILAPGTHLVTSRRGYMHHGIYVGRGMVVHYAGLSRFLHSGPVEEVTISRFSRGRPVRIIEHSESKYSPEEIVRRARSRLGENEYQVLRNNCEHFCNWCISGRSHSTQVESPLAFTLRALVIAVDCAKRLPLMLGNLPTTAGRVVRMGRQLPDTLCHTGGLAGGSVLRRTLASFVAPLRGGPSTLTPSAGSFERPLYARHRA
jgi:hypothetical protein